MKLPFVNQKEKQPIVPPPAAEEPARPQPEPRLRIEALESRVAPSLIGPGR
jgi:hypothetical protein